MKNIIKIVSVLLLVVTFSCDNSSDGRFKDVPTTGWVEFKTAASTTGQAVSSVSVPVTVNVPVYQNGLSVSYVLEAVDGDFTQFVNSSSGTAFASADDASRSLSIDLELLNMDAGRDFVTSFDVVLSAVDVSSVSIGVDESSITRHRITIPCSNPAILPSDYFVGDYTIADLDATIGPGNGTENFASGVVTLSVDPFNPNVRVFSTQCVAAFNPAIQTVTLTFTEDNVIALGDVFTGIGCSAVQYIYVEAGADNTPWDVCNDQSVTINYTEDPDGSCGGPWLSSFTMTKN